MCNLLFYSLIAFLAACLSGVALTTGKLKVGPGSLPPFLFPPLHRPSYPSHPFLSLPSWGPQPPNTASGSGGALKLGRQTVSGAFYTERTLLVITIMEGIASIASPSDRILKLSMWSSIQANNTCCTISAFSHLQVIVSLANGRSFTITFRFRG